ncbi:MAG: fatty acid desaturase [Pseudomonadota bacterium]
MDHKAWIRTLPPETLAALSETSDRAGLLHLAGHLGAILAVGAVIMAGPPGWWLLLPVQGVLLVFLFTLLHETVHFTPFRSRWLNIAAGYLAGAALLIPPHWFRYYHLAHHRHTHDPARDPELAAPKPETWAQYAWHLTGLSVWRSSIATLLRNAAGRAREPFLPERARGRVRAEAVAMLAGYAGAAALSVWYGSTALLWLWVVPAILGQPFLRLYLLAEHGRCRHVANMFENTRTTFTSRAIRWLAWNMPYHAEHHALPTVPFHRLPALHALTRTHLQVTAAGYGAFHAEYRSSLGRKKELTP